ncbi:hypothetical protein LSUB1_G003789 [Lachnellula subtilissima]|uniref:RRM domain-containing protein n=1 Tax=Lachnellula subtilissima TaxID=602034 RepID=A0A8H8UBE1_9HELO|nr:hypothetical protein LSUB1_G003789 [Lachnellula subtilissima]
MAQDYGQNASSTSSNESVRTQVPMGYHLPSEQGYNSYSNGSLDASPWSTPVLDGSGGFEDFGHSGSSARSLNPHSDPYVPGGGSFDTQGLGFQQHSGQNYNQGAWDDHQRQQLGSTQQPGEYYQQGNTVQGGPVGGSGSHFPSSSYGQLPGSPYQNYGNNYNYDMGSHASNYASSSYAPSSIQSYQTQVPYGPATGFGTMPAYGNQAYTNTPYNNIHPSDQYRGPGPRAHRNSFSSGLKPQVSHGMGKKRSVSDLHVQPSKLGSAPVRYGSPQKSNFHAQAMGGQVQPPPPSARSGSPNKSSSRGSSAAPSTSRASVSEDDIPTPGPRPRQLDLSFTSEPRHNDHRPRSDDNMATPRTLRSTRGQSIMGLNSTGHARADSTGSVGSRASRDASDFFTEPSLLDNLKDMNMDNKQTQSKRQAPPKMLNLMAASGINTTTLSPITEGPRTQLTHYNSSPHQRGQGRPIFNDPFGPSLSMMTPFTGKTLLRDEQSYLLKTLTRNNTGKPSIEDALHAKNFPFAEYCRLPKPDTWGVIKIKNIPYGVARAEVMAFLGRNARIINESEYEPVHIVMERVTSKTLDCYVEFTNFDEAVSAVNRFETNRTGGRGGRLGQRHVEVELSSQDLLMKELFPKAKNVMWSGGRPNIIPKDPNDIYSSGFQGFVSKEEVVMMVKHVEAPQRSPFSKDCPQRPFECLISTLLKYPWYMVDYITIEDRNLLFDATIELLKLLLERVNNERDDVNLTPMLLKRVWRAALRCSGFTPAQKDDVICICNIDDRTAMEIGMAPYASYWKYLWTIGPKPGTPTDLLLYYCAIIREATESKQEKLSLAERAARGEDEVQEVKLFGDLDKRIRYNPNQPMKFQTLSEVAKAEWTAIEQVLRQALTPAIEG